MNFQAPRHLAPGFVDLYKYITPRCTPRSIMKECPTCHGEGKVRTSAENASATLGVVAQFLFSIALAPLSVVVFYGFAKFISLLTGMPMTERGFGGNEGMTFLAGSLTFFGAVVGLCAAGISLAATLDGLAKKATKP